LISLNSIDRTIALKIHINYMKAEDKDGIQKAKELTETANYY